MAHLTPPVSFLLPAVLCLLSASRSRTQYLPLTKNTAEAGPGCVRGGVGGGHLSKALTTESHRVLSWLYHRQIRTELGLKVEQKASCPSGTAGDRPGRQMAAIWKRLQAQPRSIKESLSSK